MGNCGGGQTPPPRAEGTKNPTQQQPKKVHQQQQKAEVEKPAAQQQQQQAEVQKPRPLQRQIVQQQAEGALAPSQVMREAAREAGDGAAGTFAALWKSAADQFGERPFLTFAGKNEPKTYTYSEIDSLSNQYGRLLQQQWGVHAGDRIVTVSQNRLELFVLLITCQKICATFVPLAPELARADLEMLVNRYEGNAVFIEAGTESFGPSTVVCDDFSKQAEGMDDSPLPLISLPEDIAIIFSTSGTTSLPKGVMWTSKSLSHIYDGVNPPQSQLIFVPLRGVVTPILIAHSLTVGTHNIVVDHFPSAPPTWAKLIKKYDIESLLLFGGALAGMLQACPGETFDCISIYYGGSPVPTPLIQSSMRQFPKAKFYKSWGMSEVGIGTLLRPDQHVFPDAGEKALKTMESCGLPMPGCEAKIENPDEKGEGQLLFSSPSMMRGYYRNPEKTREDLPDGKWMRTGDLAKIDEAGNVYIVDRLKDVISTEMGQNVAPLDVEKVLVQHPAVGEAGVIGIQHPSLAGEMIVAWISTKKGMTLSVQEIKAFVEASGSLAWWQMPQSYEISDKPLPKPAGKVLKRALRSPEFVRENLGERILEYTKCRPDWEKRALELFDSLDYRKSGTLDEDEMTQIVGSKDARRVMEALDCNKDGGDVTRAKWINFLYQLDTAAREALFSVLSEALLSRQGLAGRMLRIMSDKPKWQVRAGTVFDKINESHDGLINSQEFSHVVGEKHAENVIKALDVNRDGGIVTRAKFMNLLWHVDDVTRTQLLLTAESALASYEEGKTA